MKRIICFALAFAMLAMLVPFSAVAADPDALPYVTSDDVGFIDYSGSDEASGSSASSAKKTFGSARASGVVGLLGKGGTMVVSGKGYVAKNYSLPKLSSPLLITSNYAGTDYKNPDPATNPSCAFKMASGASFTIQSDVIIDDIIIFQEHSAATSFVVTNGATLVIGKNVVNMSKTGVKVKIVVESGARLILGGGDFDVVSNGGEIVEGYSYEYNKAQQTAKPDVSVDYSGFEPGVAYIAYNTGKDANDGLSESTPKKALYTADNEKGVVSIVRGGGTIVVTGRLYIGADYTFPKLGGEVTITGKYGDVNYVDPSNETNPEGGMMKMLADKTFTIAGDVRLENIILFQENGQNTIKVADGGKLTIGENVIFMSKQLYNMRLEVAKGGTVVFESAEHEFDSISGDGMVIMPETLEPVVQKTELKLTIGQKVGYVNGIAKELDAAPVIKSSRTFLPVRFVAENLGATVGWDGATSTATVKTDSVTIEITIGAKDAKVNGLAIALDAPAFIENSRTYLPVRFVAENLGATVAWDGVTSTATLTK